MLRTHQLGKDQCKHPKNHLGNQMVLEMVLEREMEWALELVMDHQWLNQSDHT